MSNEIILMMHPAFGVLAVLGSVWVIVETLNVRESNQARIRTAGVAVAILIWLTYVPGGYWYVAFYGADKALIKAGPWPFAHSFFMETNEHVFLMLLILATCLPIACCNNLVVNQGARKVVLSVAALVALTGLSLEGAGAVISMGVKMALLAKPM